MWANDSHAGVCRRDSRRNHQSMKCVCERGENILDLLVSFYDSLRVAHPSVTPCAHMARLRAPAPGLWIGCGSLSSHL